MTKETRWFNLWLKNSNRLDESEWDEAFLYIRTEVGKSGAFEYGNGKAGAIFFAQDNPKFGYKAGKLIEGYDLRYCPEKDLHIAMLKEYWGRNLKAYYEYDGSQGLVPMPGTQAWIEVPHEEKKKVRL